MKAPSVIIGVGGIGSRICAKTAAMMPENTPDKNRIRFVVMDTDINTIREIHRSGFRGTEILISDNMTVGKCKEIMKENADKWYPQSTIFDKKSMTEGAGQQRAISRLAFEYALASNKMEPIEKILRELQELVMEDAGQQTRFYIISSLAGGTGSGMILPLAIYLNRLVYQMQGDYFSICKGFFVLSSALEESVDTDLEKKSLRSNAYAAVKELSNFMKMADGDWERREKITGCGDGAESYEFCYLFGRVNKNGKTMCSFEELQNMIAKAVYMQACSPIHDRNSSREDNKLRHGLMQMTRLGENSLRRFGGIGCGELTYPYEGLKRYFALQWAKEVMQKEWQQYDEEYWKRELQQSENRKNGRKAVALVRGEEYISSVMAKSSQSVFSEEIVKACKTEDGKNKWDIYLDSIRGEIKGQVERNKQEQSENEDALEYQIDKQLDELKRNSPLKEICESQKQLRRKFGEMEDNMIDSLDEFTNAMGEVFWNFHSQCEKWNPLQLEYWISENNEFIHPNAIRFFLYNLKNTMRQRIEKAFEECNLRKRDFNGLRDTTDNVKRWNKGKKVEDFVDVYKNAKEALYQYFINMAYAEILKMGEKYVDRLIEQYEIFYDSYGEMLYRFEEKILDIADTLDRISGTVKTYVCADKICREKAFQELRGKNSFLKANPSLSYYIFEILHGELDNREHLNAIFEKIESYWCDSIEKEFGSILNLNILHAMNQEERYKYSRDMGCESMQNKIEQVQQMLIEPFLMYRQDNSIDQGISICCYHEGLDSEQGDYGRVVQWLRDQESVSDTTYCSKYQLMFYRSFVGIDAYEVHEYLHGTDSLKEEGQAFQAYEEVVENMGRNGIEKTGVTPHIDRSWHNLNVMPDPKKDYQRAAEIETAEVFVYAYLKEYIKKKYEKYEIKIGEETGIIKNRLKGCLDYFFDNVYLKNEIQKILNQSIEEKKEYGGEGENVIESEKIWDAFIDYYGELRGQENEDLLVETVMEGTERLVYDILYEIIPEKRAETVIEKLESVNKEHRDSKDNKAVEMIKNYIDQRKRNVRI